MLPEHSLGCVFQQHLHFMDASQIHDFCFQNFSRLAQQVGTASAYKDAQTALMQLSVRQKRMAQMEQLQQQLAQFTAPLQLQSSSSSTAVPPTVASAAAGAAAAAAAVQSSSSSSCPAAGDPMMFQPRTPAAATSAQQVQLIQQGSAAAHSEDSEECRRMHAARAELMQQWKQQQ